MLVTLGQTLELLGQHHTFLHGTEGFRQTTGITNTNSKKLRVSCFHSLKQTWEEPAARAAQRGRLGLPLLLPGYAQEKFCSDFTVLLSLGTTTRRAPRSSLGQGDAPGALSPGPGGAPRKKPGAPGPSEVPATESRDGSSRRQSM